MVVVVREEKLRAASSRSGHYAVHFLKSARFRRPGSLGYGSSEIHPGPAQVLRLMSNGYRRTKAAEPIGRISETPGRAQRTNLAHSRCLAAGAPVGHGVRASEGQQVANAP